MTSRIYNMKGKLWIYPGETAQWHFVTLPKKVGQEIKGKFGKQARGFGSLPVKVTVGRTTWQTSIFPDKYSGSYFLPIKAKVRKEEDLFVDDVISFTLTVR